MRTVKMSKVTIINNATQKLQDELFNNDILCFTLETHDDFTMDLLICGTNYLGCPYSEELDNLLKDVDLEGRCDYIKTVSYNGNEWSYGSKAIIIFSGYDIILTTDIGDHNIAESFISRVERAINYSERINDTVLRFPDIVRNPDRYARLVNYLNIYSDGIIVK